MTMVQTRINRRDIITQPTEPPEQEPLRPPEHGNDDEQQPERVIVTANTSQTEEDNWDNFFVEAGDKEAISDSAPQSQKKIDEGKQEVGE
jgi:hypothetical protein